MEDRSDLDRQLVGEVLGGDPAAFESLVNRYQRMVAGVAWRYGATRQEIEDVVSEVFLKAYQNLARYRPDHPFSTWLYRVAANHVIDRGRRARREGTRVELPETLPDPGQGPGQGQESDERATLVREALQALPEHYRAVLFLVYIEGLNVAQTAQTLELPSGTVKTRLMRGRNALRRKLVQRFPEYFGENHALQTS